MGGEVDREGKKKTIPGGGPNSLCGSFIYHPNMCP